MNARKWLLATVTGGALIFAAGAAMAAPAGDILRPGSDWAVSRLESAQAGGQPYCALARRFSGNLVLTMALNPDGERSVAIDFQKQALARDRTYEIGLNPGDGQIRAFSVRPVSSGALVVRMGRDVAFDDALARSDRLAVDVGDDVYTFDLHDFKTGRAELETCLAGLVEPAAGDAPAVTPIPAKSSVAATVPSGDIQALREENTRLRTALERERRMYEDRLMAEGGNSSRVAELTEKFSLLQKENDDLKSRLAQAGTPDTAIQNENARLKADLDAQTERNAQLAQQLATGKATAGAEKTAALEGLRTENARLKADLDAQQAHATDLEQALASRNSAQAGGIAAQTALREENARLKQDAAVLQNRVSELERREDAVPGAADTAAIETLQGRIAALEEENRHLRSAQAQAVPETGSLASVSLAQLRSVEEQLRIVQEDRDALLAQVETFKNGREQGLLDISSNNWNLEQATRRYNEAERESRRLARELEVERTRCAAEQKKLEYMLFDPDVATQEQISRLIKLEGALENSRAALAARDQEIARLETVAADAATVAAAASPVPVAPAAPVTQAAALESLIPAAGTVSTPPAVMAEPVSPPVSVAPQDAYESFGASVHKSVVSSAPSGNGLIGAAALKSLLGQAGLALRGDIAEADPSAPGEAVAYSWETGKLFGSVEQRRMDAPERFDALAQSYLERTRARCAGDFAAAPGAGKQVGTLRVSAYEIACTNGGQGGAAAALVFYDDGGTFTVLAHEAGLNAMDTAMDARDRIVDALLNAQVAAR